MIKIIKIILIVFALGLVGLAPFFRGLIFEREMSIHHYLVAMASILVPILLIFESFNTDVGSARGSCQKPESVDGMAAEGHPLQVQQLITSPYFLALAALTALYGLSFFQAINSREGLFVWLRHLDYLLSFVLVFLATGVWEKERQQAVFVRWSLTVFAITGTAVATGGILTGQGIMSIHGGLILDRLGSTFLYPNALAAYLMATVLMAIYLAVQNNRPLIAGAFAGMGFLTFLAILGSQSRGVWVMLPFILAIFILGQRARKKFVLLTASLLGLAIILSSLTVAPQVQQLQPNWNAFLWTLAGCLATGISWGGYVRLKPKKIIIILGLLSAILIFVAGAALLHYHPGDTHETGISGNPLLKRLMLTNTADNSFQARMVYYADALKMAKDRPLLGWGGGGWNSGYSAYQSCSYISTTVHNHFLQIWVEAGTLGLIMFIAPFLFLSRGLWCLYHIRKTHATAPETWTVGIAAIALGIHSVIDFDFSFSSIALLLWALLALFAYREVVLGVGFGSRSCEGTGALGLTVLLILFFSLASIHLATNTFTLRAAVAKAEACTLAIQKDDGEAALKHIQAASRLDRWSAQYPVTQAQFLMANIEHNPDLQVKKALAQESLNLVRRAVELDSYNPDNRFILARVYLANGQLEKALAEAEQAKALKPWFIKTYEEFNSIYVNAAVQQLLRGQKEAAGDTLSRVLAATREAVVKKETVPPRLNSLWDRRPDLTLTPALALTAGQAALLMEDHNQARDFLTRACQTEDQEAKAVAQLWLGVALQKSGDLSGLALQEGARRASPYIESEYAIIKKLVTW
jgi:O-antigen ligase/tetratricopeptide (TPR) repeat protein